MQIGAGPAFGFGFGADKNKDKKAHAHHTKAHHAKHPAHKKHEPSFGAVTASGDSFRRS